MSLFAKQFLERVENTFKYAINVFLVQAVQPTLAKGLRQILEFSGDVQSTFGAVFQMSYEVSLVYNCIRFHS